MKQSQYPDDDAQIMRANIRTLYKDNQTLAKELTTVKALSEERRVMLQSLEFTWDYCLKRNECPHCNAIEGHTQECDLKRLMQET